MRNMLLIMKREYLERVRKKSFLVMTVLVPALMAGAIWIPIEVAKKNGLEQRTISVVAPTLTLAEAVKKHLIETVAHDQDDPFGSDENDAAVNKQNEGPPYTVLTSTATDESAKQELRNQVNDGRISGFLWISPEALKDRKITYFSKDSTNFSEQISLQSALRVSLTEQDLAGHGLRQQEISDVLRPVSVKSVRMEKGKESSSSGIALFMGSIMMVTLLYITVLIYGIAVMRSVIEEKGSRIMEVMLSCVRPRDLMAGKIIGVGAVGLTQIAIWMALSVALSSPAVMAFKSMAGGVHIPISSVIYFAVFFLLGYLLYSSLYAAIGAMVNSEQEAQQVQFVVLMPLIFAMVIAQTVIQHPNSQLAIWLSMIPFCAPMLMFVRILIETPPWWQIALCIGLMLATIWGILVLCAKIYRVGILMYGKRPTLPELLKWLKYSG
jgi:ABC-2 type transport system permease protein